MKRTAFQSYITMETRVTTVRGHRFSFKCYHDIFYVVDDIQVRFHLQVNLHSGSPPIGRYILSKWLEKTREPEENKI